MGVRHFADYRTNETNEEITVEIHDSSFVGSSTKLFGTGSDWASRTLEQLDPREPLSSPIQKTEVSLSVWVKSSSLIDDIFSSEEGRFTLVYKKGATQIAEVTVLQDLCSYQYLENDALWKLTLKGKDFSILEGDSYGLQADRVTIITALAEILPYGLNIKTRTSWIVDGLTAANDYLRQIYMDKFALRTYARTGDETDEPFSKLQALEAILRANGLILRQDGDWIVEQITALSDSTSVLESVYNSSGVFQSASNVNLSTAVTVINQSPYNHNPGVKSARVKYDHRTTITSFQPPSSQITTSTSEVLSSFFISNGTQTITASATVVAISAENEATATFKVQYKAGQYYWTGSVWSLSVTDVEYDMFGSGIQDGDGNYIYRGFLSEETTEIPADATSGLQITLNNAVVQGMTPTSADSTTYNNFSLVINNALELENSTFIDYQLTQSGNQSVRVDYGNTLFGDGPVAYSRGSFRTSISNADVTDGNWARRGEVSFTNHAQVLLREVIDVQRKSRAKISATVKTALEFSEVVSWDGDYYYILGGEVNLFTGVSTLELLLIDVAVASDTFEVLPKFTADSATGSATTSGGSSGGGITQSFADARYLIKSLNLSDLTDVITARNNLDLGVLDDVEFNSLTLDLDANALVYSDAGGTLATTTNATLNASGHLDVTRLQVDNIRIDGNTISTFSGNQSIILDPNGTGNTQVVGNFDVSGTIQGSVLISDVADGTAPLTVTSQTLVSNLNADLLDGYEADYFRAELVDLGLQTFALFQQKVDKGRELTIADDVDSVLTFAINTQNLIENRTWTPSLRDATNLLRGIVSVGAQSFGGVKTFVNNAIFQGDIDVSGNSDANAFRINGTTVINSSRVGTLTQLNADNIRLDANTISTTNTNGNLLLSPNGTGIVDITKDLEGINATLTEDLSARDITVTQDLRVGRNAYIEGGLFAKEFVVDTTRVMFNYQMSVGGGKIAVRSGSLGAEIINFEDEEGVKFVPVALNDILHIQVRTGFNSGVIVKNIYRKVQLIEGNDINLSTDDIDWTTANDVGTIEVGDDTYVYGNISTANRDGRINFDVSSEPTPAIRIFDNVTDVGLGDEVVTLGYLDGVATGASGIGLLTKKAFLTDTVRVGALTGVNNFLEFDGTHLDVFANSISLTATGDLSESFLDLQANVVELGLQADGAYSGIQFLAGQTIISAELFNESTSRIQLARVRLDATPDSGSVVGIEADNFLLNTTNLIIDSANELITLGSDNQVKIGKQLNLSAGILGEYKFRDDFNQYGSTVDIFGNYLDRNNYLVWVKDNEVGGVPTGYALRVGGATSNFLSVNAASGDAKINFDNFDLEAGNLIINSAGTTYPSANNVATATDTADFSIKVGSTYAVAERSAISTQQENEVLRFSFKFYYSHSTSIAYTLQMNLEGFDGSVWSEMASAQIVPTDVYFFVQTNNTNAITITRNEDNPLLVNKYRLAGMTATASDIAEVHFYFKVPANETFSQYRMSIESQPTAGDVGTCILKESEVRRFKPVTELNQNGLFFRDADVIKGELSASGFNNFFDDSAVV